MANLGFQDYYIVTDDIESSLESLGRMNPPKPIVVSFPKPLEPDYASYNSIYEISTELDIEIVHSLPIEDVKMPRGEESTFLVLNPGSEAERLCDKLRDFQKEYFLNFMVSLPDTLVVSIGKMLEYSGKSDIYQLTIEDVSDLLSMNTRISKSHIHDALMIQARRIDPKCIDFSTMMRFLKKEEVYLVHPKRDDELEIINRMSGIVYNEDTSWKFKERVIELGKECLFGSGRDYIHNTISLTDFITLSFDVAERTIKAINDEYSRWKKSK